MSWKNYALVFFTTVHLIASANSSSEKKINKPGMSTTKKVLIVVGTVGAVGAAIVAAPAVLPASALITPTAALTTTKVAVAAAATKVAPVVAKAYSYILYAKITVWLGRKIKERVYPSQEQQIQHMQEQEVKNPFEEQLRKVCENNNNPK